ncbi:MAG TPA: hypothetical protein DCL95_09550 [Rhodospirillaceae bacterium]|nr:hypothetical protein [Rhodospirillaceae bacterium]MAX63578.1 hypothetical protein [Rhodospirillaceae bacterium]MBB56350.1 hypothetical protein [Rhodospirillaceae bacterium]HAE02082.1 hypothetical protein [Rhodospirillaceae bacterium]HAJ20288.1 hypothetical protein [Rhodospirillaceae bacterium]|tara:strand:+ start:1011 stop:1295 length:285 start_codon:yes stop_codon:yes gene_type:complete
MRRLILASAVAALIGGTAVSGIAWAEENKSPESLAAEGLQQVMRAMEMFISNIPLYEAPEVLPNGDIIIRRVQPDDAPKDKDADKNDPGTTKDI